MTDTQKQKQEARRLFPCPKCDAEYEQAPKTRAHMVEKEKMVIPKVTEGKRRQVFKFVKSSDIVKYACCLCFDLSPSKDLFEAHYKYTHESAQYDPNEQVSRPLSSPLAPLSTPNNTVQQPKKRRKTASEVTTHLMGKENNSADIVGAVIQASQLSTNYITITSEEDDNEDIYFFSSPKELLKIDKFENKVVKIKAGTCTTSGSPGEVSVTKTFPDDYLHQTLYRSQAYSFILKIDDYTEISKTERDILNTDWLCRDELRLMCAQLLAGAILVENEQLLFVNTVEVYARSPSIDAHHERLDPLATFSSTPTPSSRYNNICILKYENDNSIKLIIGTFSFNALVTSSIRLDVQADLETGPSTRRFQPSKNTKLYIAKTSREAAEEIRKSKKKTLYDFDTMHQLRQLRSRLTAPSAYLISRACAQITNQIGCRPYTVFTALDSDSTALYKDEMVASMMLRLIATKIMSNNTIITKDETENILRMKDNETVVFNTIKSIMSLMDESNQLVIPYNRELESHLNTLASLVTGKLPTLNEQVIKKFEQRMEQLRKDAK